MSLSIDHGTGDNPLARSAPDTAQACSPHPGTSSNIETIEPAAPVDPATAIPADTPAGSAPVHGQSAPPMRSAPRSSTPPLGNAELSPRRFASFVGALGRTLATLLVLGVIVLAGLVIWDSYVTAP